MLCIFVIVFIRPFIWYPYWWNSVYFFIFVSHIYFWLPPFCFFGYIAYNTQMIDTILTTTHLSKSVNPVGRTNIHTYIHRLMNTYPPLSALHFCNRLYKTFHLIPILMIFGVFFLFLSVILTSGSRHFVYFWTIYSI